MNSKQQLIREIEQAPDRLVEEVLNFLLFTKGRHPQQADPNSDRTTFLEPSPENHLDNRPIWELFEETAESIPDEIVAKLPIDGAEQHDHYLYGTPKRED